MANEILEGYPIAIRIPIQWGEMDAYGHVNNTVFFRFFESARIAYLDACGFLASYEEDRIGAILHSTSCRFRRALLYPDTVVVGASASEVNEDRFVMEYRIVSVGQGEIVADGSATVVSFDYRANTKAPLPARVREGIASIEASTAKRIKESAGE